MTTTAELVAEIADVELTELPPAERLKRLVRAALNRTSREDVGPIGEQLKAIVEAES